MGSPVTGASSTQIATHRFFGRAKTMVFCSWGDRVENGKNGTVTTVPERLKMSRYSVGIIGATGRGDYGHGLDTAWQHLPECRVVAVADSHAAGLAKAVTRAGAERGYIDYRAMLDQERPDIVAIAPRWIDQHYAMAMACTEYACHIYMEKPFCRDLGEADAIVQACEMRHLKVAVAHISRHSPQLKIVQQLLADGEIGELLEIRGRGKEDARGGGEDLWVLGSHVLDLMSAIAGPPRRCHASLQEHGELVDSTMIRPGNEGIGPIAGTQVNAAFHFDRGVIGYFCSRKEAAGTPSRFGLRLYGTKGMIHLASGYGNPAYISNDSGWNSPGNTTRWRPISSNGVDEPETLAATGYEGGNPAAILDLIDAIENDRQPLCSMYEARTTIQMIMAIFQSHRQQQTVVVPVETERNPLSNW